jgi:hypothetical protein
VGRRQRSSLADGKDGIAEDGKIRLDTEAGTVGCGHEAVDPLRRAGGDVERAVAVEVGRRKAEFLWRRPREMGDRRCLIFAPCGYDDPEILPTRKLPTVSKALTADNGQRLAVCPLPTR